MEIFLYFISLTLIQLFSSKESVYRIPFGLFKQKDFDREVNIMHNYVNNGKYINFSIGTPSQITPLELDTNSQTFSISNFFFNKNLSSTYEKIAPTEFYFMYEIAEHGYSSKDILTINNSTKKEINFLLGTKYMNKKNNNIGSVGLHIPRSGKRDVFTFFESLKKSEMINSFVWTLKYFDNISLYDQIIFNEEKNNIIGEFIFGDEPCNYEDDIYKYNKKGYYTINPLSTKDTIDWEFSFSNIYITSSDNKNKKNIDYLTSKNAEIVINYSFILGPSELYYFLENNFFAEYFLNNICKKKSVNYLYTYIECDYNSSFRVSSFPDICFEHAGFETTFNLTYKDLFIVDKKNNKYLFLILKKEYFIGWVLGSVFLRKFQFVFNLDSKTIGYYKTVENPFDEDNIDNLKEKNGKIGKTVFIVILIIILSFLLVFFGMIIQRKFFGKNRKIRANELEENFSYESRNSENKMDSKDKKIINEEIENSAYYSI